MIGLLLAGCIPNGTVKLPADCVPRELDDGWAVSTPEAEGLDPVAVANLCAELFDEDAWPSVQTLHVVANGAVVAEAAFRDPADLDAPHHVQSISKSVTSLVVGTAVDAGFIDGVDAPVDQFLGEAFPAGEADKHTMTVEHLLTMSGGIDVSNTRFGIQVLMKGKEDSIEWLLEQPLYASPGEEFYYRDTDPHLLAAVVEAATGQRFEDYAAEAIFDPLDMQDASIEAAPDGAAIAAAGVRIRPRDLAKIGQLALDGGAWRGEQVVSREWMDASLTTAFLPDDPELSTFGYGYYWWLMPELGGFGAEGHGGQHVTVLPDQGVVIVLTAAPYTSHDVGLQLWDWEPMVARTFNDTRPQ